MIIHIIPNTFPISKRYETGRQIRVRKFREDDKKMTLEFELDNMGFPIPTWTNK